jgi:hypothetical protein
MADASASASPEIPPAGTRPKGISGPRPTLRILCCSVHFGGRAIGAHILRRRRAADLMICECCSDIIGPGAVVFDVERPDDGVRLVVCSDCAGLP